MSSRAERAPRSLADDLRQRGDDDLATVLRNRPDLLHPVPPDLAALVARASTSVSTSRALDRLDAWTLQVVEVIAALPEPVTVAHVITAVPGIALSDVEAAFERLRDRALIWGDHDGDGWRLVRAVREAAGPYPCGLSQPGLADFEPTEVLTMMSEAPDGVGTVIEQLLWGPPVGSVPKANRPVTESTAQTPIEWLLARRFLQPLNESTVALPREAALPLRGGAFLRHPAPAPPAVDTAPARPIAAVDSAAGQSAFTLVRWVEELLEAWSVEAPSQLRSGGVAVRDLTAAARLLDIDEPMAALVIEVACAAGLLASDEEEQPVWLPTAGYDLWLATDVADRWSTLASTWLRLPRAPGLVGQREGATRINALTAEVERPDAPELRRAVLEILAGAPTGTPVNAEVVSEQLTWARPRRTSRIRDLLVTSTLREAEALGVTGVGALSAPGRALLTAAHGPANSLKSSSRDAATLMTALLPEPVDHVLLQADLTAVAPGPLESSLAREIALMADVESTGGATVYRLTPDSLRRAFDAGRSANDVLEFLHARSRTPVPQPLTYLVEDIARRHGLVRVGSAGSYVRCDDDTAITAVLTDRRAASLRATRLAPGVLALAVSVDDALPVLRSLGLAPAVESPDGTVLIRRPDSRRTVRRVRSAPRPTELREPDPLLLSAAVKALRAGERVADASAARPGGPARLGRIPVSTPSDTMIAIRAAIDAQESVWIGYADTDGRATERIIDPVEISRGFLTAYDHRYEEVRSFALARITGVTAVSPDAANADGPA